MIKGLWRYKLHKQMDKYKKKLEDYENYDLFEDYPDLQNYYWALQNEVLVKTAADKL